MKMRNKKGQSTLEYIILVTAVIAVAIVFLNPTTGKLADSITKGQTTAAEGINTMADKLTDSWK